MRRKPLRRNLRLKAAKPCSASDERGWLTPALILRTNVELLYRYLEQASPCALRDLITLASSTSGWEMNGTAGHVPAAMCIDAHHRVVNEFWRVVSITATKASEIPHDGVDEPGRPLSPDCTGRLVH